MNLSNRTLALSILSVLAACGTTEEEHTMKHLKQTQRSAVMPLTLEVDQPDDFILAWVTAPYIARITNDSQAVLPAMYLHVELPLYGDMVDLQPQGLDCLPNARELICLVADLGPNQAAEVRFLMEGRGETPLGPGRAAVLHRDEIWAELEFFPVERMAPEPIGLGPEVRGVRPGPPPVTARAPAVPQTQGVRALTRDLRGTRAGD